MSKQLEAENNRITAARKARKAVEGVTTGTRVAEGRSITSPRGVLGPGDLVTEADFAGGKAAMDALDKKGFFKHG